MCAVSKTPATAAPSSANLCFPRRELENASVLFVLFERLICSFVFIYVSLFLSSFRFFLWFLLALILTQPHRRVGSPRDNCDIPVTDTAAGWRQCYMSGKRIKKRSNENSPLKFPVAPAASAD